MKNYIVYNTVGKILRVGVCSDQDLSLQKQKNEFVIEGIANDITQKIIDGEIIEKTLQEIDLEKPIPIPFDDKIINVTNKQYQNLLDRLNTLENK